LGAPLYGTHNNQCARKGYTNKEEINDTIFITTASFMRIRKMMANNFISDMSQTEKMQMSGVW
jgi:hypothetical protein